jgi:hypothetical protein
MKTTLTTVLILITLSCSSQTIVDVPIESKDAFTIQSWAYNEETNKWEWVDWRKSGMERAFGWIYEQRIRVEIDRYDEFKAMFIRGFEDCRDTTFLTIYGSYEKEVIKDAEDLRKVFYVNGEDQEFGTKIPRP